MTTFSDNSRFRSTFGKPSFTPSAPISQFKSQTFWGDLVPASFMIDTPIGSLINARPDYRHHEEGFSPKDILSNVNEASGGLTFSEIYNITPDVEFDLLRSRSSDEFFAIFDQVQREREYHKSFDSFGTGANLLAGVVSSVLDPLSYIPVGGAAYKAASKGFGIGKAALHAGLVAAGTVAVSEVVLYNTQQTRTAENSMINISAALVLGTGLGGAASFLSKHTRPTAEMIASELSEMKAGDKVSGLSSTPHADKLNELSFNQLRSLSKRASYFVDGVIAKGTSDEMIARLRKAGISASHQFPQPTGGARFGRQQIIKALDDALNPKPDAGDTFQHLSFGPDGPAPSLGAGKEVVSIGPDDVTPSKAPSIGPDDVKKDRVSVGPDDTIDPNTGEIIPAVTGPDDSGLSLAEMILGDPNAADKYSPETLLKARMVKDAAGLVDLDGKPKVRLDSVDTNSLAEGSEFHIMGERHVVEVDTNGHVWIKSDSGSNYKASELSVIPIDRHTYVPPQGSPQPGTIPIWHYEPQADALTRMAKAFGSEKLLGMASPVIKMAASGNALLRSVIHDLSVVPTFLASNFRSNESLRAPVESMIKLHHAHVGAVNRKAKILYKAMMKRADAEDIPFGEFNARVGRALRSEGKDIGSNVKEIERAAAIYRKDVFDHFGKLAGLDGETSSGRYFRRIWDSRLIMEERDELSSILQRHFMENNPSLLRTEAKEAAEEAIEHITSVPSGRVNPDTIVKRGPMKGRELDIDDKLIEKFLVDDVEVVAGNYTRSLAGDIELKARFGEADMGNVLEAVKAAFIKQADEVTGARAKAKILKEGDKAIDRLTAIRDSFRGLHGIPVNADALAGNLLKNARKLSYMAQNGMFLISNIADASYAVAQFGLTRTFRDGWLPLVKDLKGWRMSAKESRLTGDLMDVLRNGFISELDSVQQHTGHVSWFDKMMDGAVELSSKLTLMEPWTTFSQKMNAHLSMNFILEMSEKVAKGKKVRASDMAKIRNINLNEAKMMNIWKSFEADGGVVRDSGLRLPNTQNWVDDSAVKDFRLAMSRQGNYMLSVAGVGDKPLFFSTEIGKTISQYMSFGLAATSRISLMRLQARDMAALNASVMAMAIGAGVYTLKTKINKPNEEMTDTPEEFAINAFDSSGLVGWLFTGGTIMNEAVQGNFGVNSMLPLTESEVYGPLDFLESAAGPTYSWGKDFLAGVGNFANDIRVDGAPSQRSTNQLRKTLPFTQTFYLRSLFEAGEDALFE